MCAAIKWSRARKEKLAFARGEMSCLAALVSFSVFLAVSASSLERDALISAAIQEVKDEFVKTAEKHDLTTAEKRLRAFKKASEEALAQGRARLKFERMVKKAERKILENRRQQMAVSQTAEDKAEFLAMELFHKPGSVLESHEIARMYQESGCRHKEESTLLEAPTSCTNTRFRTPSGVCNNLQNPTYGAANTVMRRLIPARYDDGISRLRGTLQIQRSSIVPGPFSPPFPSPRVVSLGIVRDRPVNDSRFSHIIMQWGQFMDHDLDFIPEFEPEDCPANCRVIEDSCVPFPVPEDDSNVQVTRRGSTSCHGFRRSLPACEGSPLEELTPREQINGISHFIDGSMVYHHDDTVFNTMIRDSKSPDGLLNVGPPATGTTQDSLPSINTKDGPVICMDPPCFLAGDLRVNEQVSLTVMHTLWVREHNRIARALRAANPVMSSDDVFQTARSIVIAEIQKITYLDYLPLLLGRLASRLIPRYSRYDPSVFPNVPNAFATAAYRFGHSQIQPFFERLGKDYKSIPAGPLSLVDAFFDNSQFLENGGTDPILRGLVTTPARQVDEFLNTVLTNMLFASDSSSPGLDLASLNIQRGRDHGLPSYLTWKQWAKRECNVESNFRNQLTQIRLLQTYGSLNNVDLFVGGLAEEPLRGGVVGATFACIFAKTFQSVRDGDRFYFENSASDTAPFTAVQRAQIRRASLSRVICDNTDIDEIQANAFLARQRRISCSRIRSVDLNPWTSCFVRVENQNGRTNRISAFSRLQGTRTMVERQNVPSGQSRCFSLRCPTQTKTVRLTLSNSRRCPATSLVSSLPSQSRQRTTYVRDLTVADFRNKGFYGSASDCAQSTDVAVRFGGSSTAETTSAVVEMSDNEVTFIDEDEMKKMLAEDTESDQVEEDLGNNKVQEDSLVGMMEEALSDLDDDDNGKSENKASSSNEDSDQDAMEKLEDALSKIQ